MAYQVQIQKSIRLFVLDKGSDEYCSRNISLSGRTKESLQNELDQYYKNHVPFKDSYSEIETTGKLTKNELKMLQDLALLPSSEI